MFSLSRSTMPFLRSAARCLVPAFVFTAVALGAITVVYADDSPAFERVRAIAELLPASPRGVGAPATDREAWARATTNPAFQSIVRRAEDLLDEPMPPLTDDAFLDFSKTGNRTRGQRVISRRTSRVHTLALAECVEHKGRFIPALEEAIADICRDKTWVLPAHDRSLANFRQETIEIDLNSSAVGWMLATIDYWLADELSPKTRAIIRENLERRIFQPFEQSLKTGSPRLWWLTTTNNWNAVCLAGVTGAALENIESRERRAYFVAAAEKFIRNFLSGFTPDGYCSEGIGYWNYGFGRFVMLSETVYQATGGRLDWLGDEAVRPMATFGYRMEMTPGIYPAFADCAFGSKPNPILSAFLSRRLGLGMDDLERRYLGPASGPSDGLYAIGIYVFPNSALKTPPSAEHASHALRDWFSDAGILIARGSGQSSNMAVALKGGHNAEHHNHNDVGTYVVALGSNVPLVDPGGEIYTARTFSSRRYESNLLNSYGHPVPVVAGKLQRPGRDARARVIETDFNDRQDRLVLDLTDAYAVDSLDRLVRSFTFSRDGSGSLTVNDTVTFHEPASFETALLTFDSWKRQGDTLIIGQGNQAVSVQIDTNGTPYSIAAETIEEDIHYRKKPTRVGIALESPVKSASVTLTIRPLE